MVIVDSPMVNSIRVADSRCGSAQNLYGTGRSLSQASTGVRPAPLGAFGIANLLLQLRRFQNQILWRVRLRLASVAISEIRKLESFSTERGFKDCSIG